jgi:hypothetical protein
VLRQASSRPRKTIAPASQKVMPTQGLCGPWSVVLAKARLNTSGPMIPAMLDRLPIAPCSRPCSVGATC